MTKTESAFSLPFRSFLYAIIAIASELVALFAVLFYIDETPLEGNLGGAMLVMAAFALSATFAFFVLHRVFFGRLRELQVGLRAHWSRAWAGYLLIPVGIIAENIGITGSGAVVRIDRSWLEMAWNGPGVLALIPVLVDVLRIVIARLYATIERWSARQRKVLLAIALCAVVLAVAGYQYSRTSASTVFTLMRLSPSYVEYVFDSGEDVDLGFTKRAYEKMKDERELPDAGSVAVGENHMTYVRLAREDLGRGIVERRTWGDDTYELRQSQLDRLTGTHRMFLNGQLLFKEKMHFAAEGPVLDWRMVNGEPAFTFTVSCAADEAKRVTCDRDVWHGGNLVSKTFGVENPRYVFSHDGKIGFIASHDGLDKVSFGGEFITPGFDMIWTHNCCSYTEILPTVFENGVLLVYAIRDGENILAETRLE